MAFFEVKAEGSVLDNTEAQSEARTVFTSGGNYFLALNTTYLIYYGIILGLALLALLALSGIGGGNSAEGYGSGYSRHGQEYVHGQQFHHQRQRRFAAWDSGTAIYFLKKLQGVKYRPLIFFFYKN